jgi:hypothetical protein
MTVNQPHSPDDLLRVALELEAATVDDDSAATHERLKETLEGLGVDPSFIARARVVLDERRALQRRRRRTRALTVGGLAVAAVMALGIYLLLRPPPAWSAPLDANHWSWAQNEESSGALLWVPDAPALSATRGSPGLPAAFVDYFKADQRGTWRADLVARGLPDLEGHERLHLEVQSSLATARLVLSAGPDERWVSPPLELTETWQMHTLALRSFEHQRLERRGWKRAGRSERRAPRDIDAVALSLGEMANPVHASGWLRLRGFSAE